MDFANMKTKKLGVVTDKTVAKLPVMRTVMDSLAKNGINFDVFEDVTIEPTDISFKKAIGWARTGGFDSYLAIGKLMKIVATRSYSRHCLFLLWALLYLYMYSCMCYIRSEFYL